VLVVDAGTAITYDVINDRGQYFGGNISPGIHMRYKALHEFTRKLPLIDMIGDYPQLGRNTRDAIISGVLQGIICEVEGTIDNFSKNFPELRVVITGGDAGFFDKKLKKTIFVVPNLVLLGLNSILQYNLNDSAI
jgi:type III pantothenate kinase